MQILTEKEAEAFLEKQKLQVLKHAYVETHAQAKKAAKKIGYPVALKVVGKKILHKSDVGGVKIDIRTEEELSKAFSAIIKIKGADGALVQTFIIGHQILLGIKKDAVFGHVLAVGTGGIYTEILKDVAFHIGSIKKHEALELVKGLKIYPMLLGARGSEKANLDALTELMIDLAALPKKFPSIEELDVNPVIVNAKGAYIADARIIFAAPVPRGKSQPIDRSQKV